MLNESNSSNGSTTANRTGLGVSVPTGVAPASPPRDGDGPKKGTALVKFNFHGDQLDVVQHEGECWVGLRRLCEPFGIDVHGQLKKLKELPWACGAIITSHDASGRTQELFCLNLRSVNGWLFTLNAGKVAPHVRPKLVRYQRECADVLADHFLGKRCDGSRLLRPGKRVEFWIITPEQAADMLRHRNSHNRSLSPKHVDRLVRDIAATRWTATHQGLALGPDGEIIDGQHRLAAIAKAGVPCEMMVTVYEDAAEAASAKLRCDTGRPKSGGDVFDLRGLTTTGKAVVAVVRTMFLLDQQHVTLSLDECAEFYLSNKEAIDWAITSLVGKEFRSIQQAAFAYAYGAGYAIDVQEFAEQVKSKTGILPGSPAQTYAKASVDGTIRTSGGSNERRACMLKILRILKAHVRGEGGLTKLYATEEGLEFFKARKADLARRSAK